MNAAVHAVKGRHVPQAPNLLAPSRKWRVASASRAVKEWLKSRERERWVQRLRWTRRASHCAASRACLSPTCRGPRTTC
eukprot:259980-Pleurochrysis_carterae.AAC.1